MPDLPDSNNEHPQQAEETTALPLQPAEEPKRKPGVWATFREGFQRANENRRRAKASAGERRAQNRDRSRHTFLMAAGLVLLVIVFLGVFSSSNSDAKRDAAVRRGNPSLGRPDTQDANGRKPGSVAPLLNAELNGQDPNSDQLTAEDIGSTAHPKQSRQSAIPAPPTGSKQGRKAQHNQYALNNIPMEDPALEAYRAAQLAQSRGNAVPVPAPTPVPTPAAAPPSDAEILGKSSLVYVRNRGAATTPEVRASPAMIESAPWSGLPAGTRLVARIQTAVSTAVRTPIVAVIEAHYERDGEIVVPAGTKALGELQSANRSGHVGLRFHSLLFPDGSTEKIEAGAVSLTFAPLKGQVTGTNRGKQFLARTLTGVGTVAAFAVGNPGGINGPINSSILMRERLAQNIGIAGEQELMNLAYGQDVVVTLPGNTRFFLVMQQPAGRRTGEGALMPTSNSKEAPSMLAKSDYPTAAELRELLALKQELNRMARETSAAKTVGEITGR